MTREEAIAYGKRVIDLGLNDETQAFCNLAISALSENKGEDRPKGHWIRMSDLPEDKDDRYKCSQCGNVVHHSNGVNLYTFNSWCGRCGSLNNSLLAELESHRAESEVKPNETDN